MASQLLELIGSNLYNAFWVPLLDISTRLYWYNGWRANNPGIDKHRDIISVYCRTVVIFPDKD